eukprot:jgi/Mesvir1/27257/Mv07095-RA.1
MYKEAGVAKEKPAGGACVIDELSSNMSNLLKPDSLSRSAMQREAWGDQELWKNSMSKLLGRELVQQLDRQDWAAIARVFFWCPCKRTNVVPDSPSNSKGGDPGVDQGQQHEGGPTQGGRPSSPPAGPLPPASSSAPSRGQGHDTTRSSEKGSAGLLVDTCYGCPVPPCLWERVATYTDAAEERFEMLREPSPCLSMDKPAAAQGCLLSIPGPHMDITAWASGRGSAAGRPSPSLLRWTSCAAVLGDECGCDARNAAHVRGMLLEIPLGFAGMVREWNQSAERSASWRPLRCPWCPAPAVCGDNLLFIPSKEYLGLIDGAALVCSQGHLLVWSVHT